MKLFDHRYNSVPRVCHNLQLDTFTSQVVENQFGARSPLGVDSAYQSHIKLNREATAGLCCVSESENHLKSLNIPGTWHMEDNIR